MQNGFLKKDVLLYEYFLLNESLAQPESVSLFCKGLMASPEQLHKPCSSCRNYLLHSMGACEKKIFWQKAKKNRLGSVRPVSVRTRFEPPQSCWTLNWTSGSVRHKGWTLNWTSVRFSKVQVRTSVLDWTSATLGIWAAKPAVLRESGFLLKHTLCSR